MFLANKGQKYTVHYLPIEFLQEVLPSQSTRSESQKLASVSKMLFMEALKAIKASVYGGRDGPWEKGSVKGR